MKRQIGVGGLELGDVEKAYVNEVLASNRLSYGPFSKAFERLFADLHECKHAVLCNSGTSALHVSLAALKVTYGWSDGDEVLVPAITFVATSNIVLHNNLRPVFVDVDPLTYNIDPTLLEAKLTPRTRAILPVHLMGLPCAMDEIRAFAAQHDLRIIEDSCETMFAKYRDQTVGSFGDLACFSTYIAHYIVTGVGGIVTTNDDNLAVLTRSLINHGRDPRYLSIDDDDDLQGEDLDQMVRSRFSWVHLGHSFRATEMEAAIGLAQLERSKAIIKQRVENSRTYIEALGDLEEELQLPTVPSDREHVFMLFPLVVKNEPKTELVNLLERSGIETRELMPLLRQPLYRRIFGDIYRDYPVASFLDDHGFYIGCHQYLQPEDLEYVVTTIRSHFRRSRG